MKQLSTKNNLRANGASTFILLLIFILPFSLFSAFKNVDDFLKQLGISKAVAEEKMTNSILGGSLDIYGIKNAKNILPINRKAVCNELLAFVKRHVNSALFIKEYKNLKEKNKPTLAVAQTVEEIRNENISNAKKHISEMEAMVKKADAASKPLFESVVVEAKKNLALAEDVNNKQYVRYSKGYDKLVKDFEEINKRQMQSWEEKYPTNHLLFVKKRLLEFMNETSDIDFDAELISKNDKKIFVNPDYERKSKRWKMAFRAGKEVVEPSREFVQKWIEEIN
jgi:hypothetical protein